VANLGEQTWIDGLQYRGYMELMEIDARTIQFNNVGAVELGVELIATLDKITAA
jgi:hypothetical protein